ncbi:MAG TPA: TIGR00266 family protein, partial [Polyangiaceae bacterium LLY-WYZ-15_(1-7)]|nr:TIGR00266 family protein [Polyangiaceae bacterium LLY-WYZ-15_(1-7)]
PPTPQHEITHGPSFSMLRVDVAPGQTVVAEAGSMVARNQNVEMEVKMNASANAGFFAKLKAFFIALIRKIVGGETFFVNHFSSPQGGSVWIAPQMAGSISHRRMQGETLTLSTGAFLCSSGPLEMKLKFGGFKSLLAKEGAFFLQVSGHGDLWFNSYGGIHAVDVNGPFMVDNGHLVGFEGNLTFNIKSVGGGVMGFVASGEGLVCEFNGQGRVYLQSRNLSSLVGWLTPLLPS